MTTAPRDSRSYQRRPLAVTSPTQARSSYARSRRRQYRADSLAFSTGGGSSKKPAMQRFVEVQERRRAKKQRTRPDVASVPAGGGPHKGRSINRHAKTPLMVPIVTVWATTTDVSAIAQRESRLEDERVHRRTDAGVRPLGPRNKETREDEEMRSARYRVVPRDVRLASAGQNVSASLVVVIRLLKRFVWDRGIVHRPAVDRLRDHGCEVRISASRRRAPGWAASLSGDNVGHASETAGAKRVRRRQSQG